MSNQPKKQSFLGGAAVLAAAVVVVKLIGAAYKLPLNNILGDVGMSYWDTAYKIYNFLLTFSTAGLPLAISKLTSEAHTRGRENEKRKIFRTAIWLFFALGLVGSLLMFFQADVLVGFLRNESAMRPVQALAPAVFCVCILACMRGYTQGQGNMTPTAVSQILEALCKVGIGLPLAWYLLNIGRDKDVGASGAILGVTIGTVVSMLFLCIYLFTHRDHSKSLDVPSGSGTLVKRILAIGVPITLGNSAMSIISILDTKIVLGRLQDGLNLAPQAANALNGQYTTGMVMPNMVASFVYPVTMSLLPFAAAALARNDVKEADRTISTAFRLLALLALPAGIGLIVLATPIEKLVLPSQQELAVAAGPHLQILGIATIFICLMVLTNAILQTYGKEKIPIYTVITGGVVKIVLNYILVGNPEINIHGAPISTLCCYMVIAGLNLFFVWKYSPQKPKYLQLFTKPVIASALMGVAAWAAYGFLDRALESGHSAYLANAVATMGGILVGVVVYFVLVIALRILQAEDLRGVPHGGKLIRLLHLK